MALSSSSSGGGAEKVSQPESNPGLTASPEVKNQLDGGITEAGIEAAKDPNVSTVGEDFAGFSTKGAVKREIERAKKFADDLEAKEKAKVDHIAAVSERMRNAYEDSEQGAVAEQSREAERIMALPTPEALKEMGSVVGDPRKGPAS